MQRTAGILAVAVLLAVAPSCTSLNPESAGEFAGEVAEFLGASDPVKHAGRLETLHDTASFRHVPDEPGTVDRCLAEVRNLAGSDYGTWREAAVATVVLMRVATEDPVALNRGEAVRALERFGTMLGEAEDPPVDPAPEDEISRGLPRLRALHGKEDGLHAGEAEATECAALVRRIGDFHAALPVEASLPEVRLRLKILRGTLRAVLIETRSEAAHADVAVKSGIDRAAVNLGVQAVRVAAFAAMVYDPDDRVREEGATAIGRIRAPGAAAMLKFAFTRERDATVRRRLVQSLGTAAAAGDRQVRDLAIPVLVLALEDDDRSVGWNARDALRVLAGKDLGDRAEPWILWWDGARQKP
jgi:hypothetical protein